MRPMSHLAAATMITGILADDLCGVLLDAPTAPERRRARPQTPAIDPSAPAATPRSARPAPDLIRLLDRAV